MKLLEHVGKLIEQEGYVIENIDATVIAQKPKLRPYIEEMEENIAKTTAYRKKTDQCQSNDRRYGLVLLEGKRGIAAQAICSLNSIYDGSYAVADTGAGCSGMHRMQCRQESGIESN